MRSETRDRCVAAMGFDQQDVVVPDMRSLLPHRGNAMRPVFLFLAGAFGVMLVAFPVSMHLLGLSTAGIVSMTLLIVVVTVGILALIRYMARAYDVDEAILAAGEAWAEWTLSPEEHKRFVTRERRSSRRLALAYAGGGVLLGLVVAGLTDDRLLGGVMIAVFLLAAGVVVTMGGPSQSAGGEAGRIVRIGPRGVHLLGRYLPLEATLTRLHAVSFQPGDPAELRFTIRSGRRMDVLNVPVPRSRAAEADALIARFRHQYDL
jgi:hypothetical protein